MARVEVLYGDLHMHDKCTIVHGFRPESEEHDFYEKGHHRSERAPQEEQNGTNSSLIAHVLGVAIACNSGCLSPILRHCSSFSVV